MRDDSGIRAGLCGRSRRRGLGRRAIYLVTTAHTHGGIRFELGSAVRAVDGASVFPNGRADFRAAALAESPSGLNWICARGAEVQLAGGARTSERLTTPLAIAQPLGKVYVASIAVHSRLFQRALT
jgi:hypothetical protein